MLSVALFSAKLPLIATVADVVDDAPVDEWPRLKSNALPARSVKSPFTARGFTSVGASVPPALIVVVPTEPLPCKRPPALTASVPPRLPFTESVLLETFVLPVKPLLLPVRIVVPARKLIVPAPEIVGANA